MGSSAASFRASASGTASGSAAWISSPPAQALAALQTSTTRRHHGVLRCRRREFGDSLLLLRERATKQVTVGGPLAPAAAVRAGSVVQREARGRSAHGPFQGRVRAQRSNAALRVVALRERMGRPAPLALVLDLSRAQSRPERRRALRLRRYAPAPEVSAARRRRERQGGHPAVGSAAPR
jgi:hypothetical protein